MRFSTADGSMRDIVGVAVEGSFVVDGFAVLAVAVVRRGTTGFLDNVALLT